MAYLHLTTLALLLAISASPHSASYVDGDKEEVNVTELLKTMLESQSQEDIDVLKAYFKQLADLDARTKQIMKTRGKRVGSSQYYRIDRVPQPIRFLRNGRVPVDKRVGSSQYYRIGRVAPVDRRVGSSQYYRIGRVAPVDRRVGSSQYYRIGRVAPFYKRVPLPLRFLRMGGKRAPFWKRTE